MKDEAPKAQWYVVHTYSGYENQVAKSIMKKAETLNLKDKIIEVQIPTEKKIDASTKREYQSKVFPGYVLCQMIYDAEAGYLIRSIRGVTGILGSDPNKPTPLSPAEVQAMGGELAAVYEVAVKAGDSVRIVGDISMNGLTGTVVSVNVEEGTCEVLLPVFGDETPTELPLVHVEAI